MPSPAPRSPRSWCSRAHAGTAGEDIRTGWRASRTSFVDLVGARRPGRDHGGTGRRGRRRPGPTVVDGAHQPRLRPGPRAPPRRTPAAGRSRTPRRSACRWARWHGWRSPGCGVTLAHPCPSRPAVAQLAAATAVAGEAEPEPCYPGRDDRPGGRGGGVHDPRPVGRDEPTSTDPTVTGAPLHPADALDRIVYLLDRALAEPTKVRAFARARDVVLDRGDDEIARLHAAGKLTDLPGVGPTTAKVITESLDGEVPGLPGAPRGGDGPPGGRGRRGAGGPAGRLPHPLDLVRRRGAHREDGPGGHALGHEYMVLTDHSPRLTVAHGLNAERLLPSSRRWPSSTSGWRRSGSSPASRSTSSRTGPSTRSDELLARLDVVVASVHSKLRMERPGDDPAHGARRWPARTSTSSATAPGASWWARGRPPSSSTPRSSSRRAPSSTPRSRSTAAPSARTRPTTCSTLALDWGLRVAVDTDAHAPGQLEWQTYGCDKAARHGIEPERIVNTLPADDWWRGPPATRTEHPAPYVVPGADVVAGQQSCAGNPNPQRLCQVDGQTLPHLDDPCLDGLAPYPGVHESATTTATKTDAAYVEAGLLAGAEDLARRVDTLASKGQQAADLGDPDELADRMLAAVPEPSPWRRAGPLLQHLGTGPGAGRREPTSHRGTPAAPDHAGTAHRRRRVGLPRLPARRTQPGGPGLGRRPGPIPPRDARRRVDGRLVPGRGPTRPRRPDRGRTCGPAATSARHWRWPTSAPRAGSG